MQWLDHQISKTRTVSYGTNRELAERMAARKKDEMESGLFKEIKTISFDDFRTEHLDLMSGSLHEKHRIETERVLRQFKDACNPPDLVSIDFHMLEQFKKARKKDGIMPATLNKCMATLQAALGKAVKRGYLKENPINKENRNDLFEKAPERDFHVITQDEFNALLAACPNDCWRGIFTVANYTGLRRSEILALEWDNVDFDNDMIKVRNKTYHMTKSRKIRDIPMAPQVKVILNLLRLGFFKNSLVFTNGRGQRITNNFDRDFEVIMMRAGLMEKDGQPPFTLHDFRKTFCTELQRKGVPIKTAQKILGHANLTTTAKYYTGVEEKDLRDAIAKLSATA